MISKKNKVKSLRLGTRLALFNLISKIVFTILFISFLPVIVSRISLIQTDNELVSKREQVIGLISEIGIEPFISDSVNAFGSYNILKEEFISLEKENDADESNFIEIAGREIDNEIIDYRVLNYSFDVNNETYLLQIGKSLDSITITQNNIRRIILIFLVFIILITLISDLFYTELLLRPLRIIVNKLKHTSTPAVFDSNPVKTNTSDFMRLDKAIVELMNRIDDLISKEREITVNMSHELLTPVSVIRGQLENILSKNDIDDETCERVEESLRTLHRLKTLINSLLFFARIESQQYLKEDSFEITDLMKDVHGELAPIASDKGLDFTIE
jgi:signal transduction histidine kinase